MPRKPYYWKLDHRELALGQRTLIAGVLNITPDSFHDGGRYQEPDRAYARALELEEQGAGIIDIGAESTRPGASRITAAQELHRLVPVLKRLRDKLRVPISVDTYKAEVAERALDLGAEIINDPSGLTFEPGLAKVVVQYNAGLILNHMRGNPESWGKLAPIPDVMGTIVKELEATVSRARHAGVDKTRIVVDPGLGFGKRKEQNSEILARLSQLSLLDLPIMAGPSNKSFLAQPTPEGTRFATACAVTAAILAGAHIVRVHDVAEMHAVTIIADEVARSAALLPSVQ
jgi:dihydropteroate synthase